MAINVPLLRVLCGNVAEYVACIVDQSELARTFGAPVFPVFNDATSTPDTEAQSTHVFYPGSSSLYLVGRQSRSEHISSAVEMAARANLETAHCIAVVAGDDASLVGAAYALATHRCLRVLRASPFWDGLSACAAGFESLVLVVSLEQLVVSGFDCLWHQLHAEVSRTGERTPEAWVSWGVLTASTLAGLSQLTGRLVSRRPPTTPTATVFWFGDGMEPAPIREPGFAVYQGGSGLAVSQELSLNSLPAVILRAHGRSYCAAQGHLCSRGTVPTSDADHSCIGDFQCRDKEWPRIPAGRLRADVVVLDTCSSGGIKHGSSTIGNLAIRLLEGNATAVLAPTRTYRSSPLLPFIVWRLLAEGRPIGTVCHDLNAWLQRYTECHDSFVLFGDPAMLAFAPIHRAPTRLVAAEPQGEDVWLLELPASDQLADVYECRGVAVAELARSRPLHVMSARAGTTPVPVYCVQFFSGQSLRLLVLRLDAPARGTVHLELTTVAPFSADVLDVACALLENDYEAVFEEFRGSDEVGDLCGPGGDPRGRANDLRSMVRGFARDAMGSDRPIHDPMLYGRLRKANESTVLLSERISRRLLELVSRPKNGGGLWLHVRYSEGTGIAVVREEVLGNQCPICDGGMNRLVYRAGLWPKVVRWLTECERCGFVSDVPEHYPPMVLSGQTISEPGTRCTMTIEGGTRPGGAALMHATIVVDHRPTDGKFHCDPPMKSATLTGGSAFAMSFDLSTATDMRPHEYNCKGIVVVNGTVLFAYRKVWIVGRHV